MFKILIETKTKQFKNENKQEEQNKCLKNTVCFPTDFLVALEAICAQIFSYLFFASPLLYSPCRREKLLKNICFHSNIEENVQNSFSLMLTNLQIFSDKQSFFVE